MDEFDEISYFRDPEPARDVHRSKFSVATLFRATTMVAMLLGWMTLVATVPPQINLLAVLLTATLLSAIVGHRRFGKPWRRRRAALLFLAGGFIIAVYSTGIAIVIRNPIEQDQQWASLAEFLIIPIIVAFPIVLIVGVSMLRSWVWSANDRSIHKQH